MKIKLERIIIFNKDGDKREVKLESGLNIITGYSKKGKSALLEIVNYCFLSSISTIPVGVIRNFAHIYLLILNIEDNLVVIGREELDGSNCYIFDIDNLEDIDFDYFNKENAISVDNARSLLSKKLGINIDDKYLTKSKGKVSIRNLLPYILQPQHLVANKYALFISFDDYYRKTAIIEEFPFFLKIINNDYLNLKRNIDELKKGLKKEKIEISAKEKQFEDVEEEIKGLIKDYLENIGEKVISEDKDQLFRIDLNKVFKEKFKSSLYEKNISFRNLIQYKEERTSLYKEVQEINNQLKEMDLTNEELYKYYDNSKGITSMINSFDIDKNLEFHCPLCGSESEDLNKEILEVKNISIFFEKESENVKAYNSNIDNKRFRLLNQKKVINQKIKILNQRIEEQDRIENDGNHDIYEKMLVLKTTIEVKKDYLKNLMGESNKENLSTTEQEIKNLEDKLNGYNLGSKINTLKIYLNNKINQICNKLDIEDTFRPSKLNFNFEDFSLTYGEFDKVYLSEIGSGANILAWHISLFLGLLWLSLKTDSYIPKFLFIDQPSQVYFPDSVNINNDVYEGEISDEDSKKVSLIYTVILDELKAMKEEFNYEPQVVVLDHANNLDLGDYKFNDYVRKNWRDGTALI